MVPPEGAGLAGLLASLAGVTWDPTARVVWTGCRVPCLPVFARSACMHEALIRPLHSAY